MQYSKSKLYRIMEKGIVISLILIFGTIPIIGNLGCTSPPPGEESKDSDDLKALKIIGGSLALLFVISQLIPDDEPENEVPDFFICNYWEDKNQDGVASHDEYIGINNQFRAHEKITVVARITGKRGGNLKRIVRNAANKIVFEDVKVIPYDNSVLRISFEPRELYNLGGIGKYAVEWHLNNNLIATKSFDLIN